MRKAPTKKSNESASVTAGVFTQADLFGHDAPASFGRLPSYPPSRASATAHVLTLLLEGRHLTSHDVLFECGSSRAAAIIERLIHGYMWPIHTEDWTVGTSDGRVASIVRYFLGPETIAYAMQNGADTFISQTRKARAEQRKTAPAKYRAAQEANAARNTSGRNKYAVKPAQPQTANGRGL